MAVFFNTYANLDKVDLKNYKPKLEELSVSDKWLIKTTDELIKRSIEHMNDYNLRDVTQDFEKFVDDVSNFYIRINRRRFWKSENSLDKKVAYYSLFYALRSVTSIMGPMIPFMTEYIYQTVIRKYDESHPESLFLNSYPTPSEYKIDEKILTETDNVREVITSALKLRNESNVKVRQPLQTLYLLDKVNLDAYEDIIKNELNIKNIEYLKDFSSLKEEYLTINFKTAGSILKGDVNMVKDLLSNITEFKEYVFLVKNNQEINIPGYDQKLVPEIFNLEAKEMANISIMENDNLKVALDLNITEELKKEGILREIIRNCQVFRKDVGFNVEDRILIHFTTDNDYINNIINEFKDIIESELLANIQDNQGISKEIIEDDFKLQVKLEKKL
ncbi:MAG: class I tRNA ligase family protein [Mollicutes bacterium]|nr:class I tRNA ligase family protein [Mollicutes bacterium]